MYKSDRQLERQTNILHMARKLAGTVGYDGLTMRDLAVRADVSPKTLYNLFGSKDDLLIAALQDLMRIIRRSVEDHSHLNGIDYILNVRESGSKAIARSPGFANVIVNLFFRAQPHDQLVESLFSDRRNDTIEQIEYEQANGSITSNISARTLAIHLFAQSWSTLLAWDKGLIALEDIVEAEQLSYLTTLMSVASEKRRRELARRASKIRYELNHRHNGQAQSGQPGLLEPATRQTYSSERQRQRRARILSAVRSAITNGSYHGMTMRGLAVAAQVSPKTLYNIYGSKDELLLSAVIDLLAEVRDSEPRTINESAVNTMILRQETVDREIRRNPEYAQAITQALLLSKPGDRLVNVLMVQPTRAIDALFRNERPSCLVKGIDPMTVAQMLSNHNWGILLAWCKGIVDLDTAIKERFRGLLMTLSGVTTGKTRTALLDLLKSVR